MIEVNEYIYETGTMWWDNSDCMAPEDLSFHFSAMQEMIEDYRPYTSFPPTLKSIVTLKVSDDLIGSTKLHSCAVTYGTLVELKAETPAPLDLTEF